MALNQPNKPITAVVTISSIQELHDENRDFIVDLVSEEARSVISKYSFILHDAVESKKYVKLLVEGSKTALDGLLLMLETNLPYMTIYLRRCN